MLRVIAVVPSEKWCGANSKIDINHIHFCAGIPQQMELEYRYASVVINTSDD